MSEIVLPRRPTGIARRRLRFLVWTFRGSPSTLLVGITFMLTNLLIDLAYGWLDPRTRAA